MGKYNGEDSVRPLSNSQQMSWIRKHSNDLHSNQFSIKSNAKNAHLLLEYFISLENCNISPLKYSNFVEKLVKGGNEINTEEIDVGVHMELSKLYSKFVELKKEQGIMFDWTDQMLQIIKVLDESKDAIDSLDQFRYSSVLIDDLQDMNLLQFELIKRFAKPKDGRKVQILGVGDDDKSIFSYNGADSSIFEEFLREFPESQVISLRENHRSVPDIVEGARRLIANNRERFELTNGFSKHMKSTSEVENSNIEGVKHIQFLNEREGDDQISEKIEEIWKSHEGEEESPSIAVLARSNSEVADVRRRLMQRGIRVQQTGTQKLFDSSIVSLSMSFLNCLVHPTEFRDLYQLLSSRIYKFPAEDLARLTEVHLNSKNSLRNALKSVSSGSPVPYSLSSGQIKTVEFSSKATEIARNVVEELENFEDQVTRQSTSQIIFEFLSSRNIIENLKHPDSLEEEEEGNSLAKLLELIDSFEKQNRESLVPLVVSHLKYLQEQGQELSNFNEEDFALNSLHQVRLSTVHRARAEEYDYVFLIDASSNNYPTIVKKGPIQIPNFSVFGKTAEKKNSKLIEEERRLVYTALTRARRGFFFVSGKPGSPYHPSRFINETLGIPSLPTLKKQKKSEIMEEENSIQKASEVLKNKETSEGNYTLKVPGHRLNELNFPKIASVLNCPLQFCYENVLKIPSQESKESSVGSILSSIVSDIRRDPSLSKNLESVEWKMEEMWQKKFGSADLYLAEKEALRKTLREFSSKFEPESTSVYSERFSFDLEGIKINGEWDHLDKRNKDEVEIKQLGLSLKKSKKIPKRARKERDNLELGWHAWAFWKDKNDLAAKVVQETMEVAPIVESNTQNDNSQIGRVGTVVEMKDPTPEEIKSVDLWVKSAIERMRSGVYPATPSYKICQMCSFQSICPASFKKNSPSSLVIDERNMKE
eukprot:TRINITY_DN3212_c0_g1_i3.p1 TRINITY_DN3212_c0_g1~~TRINITY_DN3212_c0_g1_i3.p1  ORF type:complete len:933 (-),score=321.22 TRINITY_DN3212_c0_g1_i3:62-2860(-)